MKTSIECNAGGHDSCPHVHCACGCECHLARSDFDKPKMPESDFDKLEIIEEQTYPEAQLLAPIYTDAHWAIEKAIEVYKAHPGESTNIIEGADNIIEGAGVILEFLREHAYGSAGEDAETEVLYDMNSEPLHTVTKPRGSWK